MTGDKQLKRSTDGVLMTRTLTGTLTDGESVDADLAELELAEAQAAAAEAEAAAARARADVARARARAARGKQSVAEPAADEVASTAEAKVSGVKESGVTESGVTESGVTESAGENDASVDPSGEAEPESAADSADSDTVADTVAAAGESGRPRRLFAGALRRPTLRGVALAVLLLITAGAIAGAAGIGWQHHRAGEDASRATRFVDAAELGVVAITSLDYRNAERDVKRIVERSTGEFAKDFTDRSKDFTSVIQKSQVTTKGKVTAAALESIKGDTATILVAAASEVTNAAGATQEPRTWRLRVSVTDVNGTVKVSKVDFVP